MFAYVDELEAEGTSDMGGASVVGTLGAPSCEGAVLTGAGTRTWSSNHWPARIEGACRAGDPENWPARSDGCMLFAGRGGSCGVKSCGMGRVPSAEDRGDCIEIGRLRGDAGMGGGGIFETLVWVEPYDALGGGPSCNGAGGNGGDPACENRIWALLIKSSISES